MKKLALVGMLLGGVIAVVVALAPHAAEARRGRKVRHMLTFGMGEGRLGAEVVEMSEELRKALGAPADAGVLVNRVAADSAAARAGVRAGDVITHVDGAAVDDAFEVMKALAGKGAGTEVKLSVVRDRKPITLTAKLTDDAHADFEVHVMGGPHAFAFGFGADDALRDRIRELEKRIEALEKKVK